MAFFVPTPYTLPAMSTLSPSAKEKPTQDDVAITSDYFIKTHTTLGK
jgi:hypothetical protein